MRLDVRTGAAALVVVALAGAVPAAITAQASAEAPSSGIGFTVRTLRSADGASRPVRLLIWYPALSDGTPMQFGDYLGAAARDTVGDAWLVALGRRERETGRRQFSPASDSLLRVIESRPVPARLDATPRAGRHPAVVHLLGLGDWSLESTELWERLAADGSVVAVVAQVPGEPEAGFSFGTTELLRQARDARRAIGLLGEEPMVDRDRFFLVGHSSGGLVALLLASDTPGLRGIAMLDGSAATRDGAVVLDSLAWSAASVAVPVLNLYRAANRDRDLRALAVLPRQLRIDIEIGGDRPPTIVTHFDFQNWPLYAIATGVPDPRGVPARPAATGAVAYRTVIDLVRRWVRAPHVAIDSIHQWVARQPNDVVPVHIREPQQ